jgi:hypothetical protein
MARRHRLLGPALCALVLAGAPAALGGQPPERFFAALGGAITCQLNDGGGLGVEAYCQTVSPPRSVTLSAKGRVKTCSGRNCIGNPPDGERTLAAGHSLALGPFSCKATASAVDCRLASGAGFAISLAGVKKT